MEERDFEYHGPQVTPGSGSVRWSAPSNIALVKYWGKHGVQLPANPSLSFTLDACTTRTELFYHPKKQPGTQPEVEVVLDGLPAPGFIPKVRQFLERARPYMPWLDQFGFRLETSNSFPHSSGIASSASGMAALALCLVELERGFYPQMPEALFRRKASFLARLGSGSAARSIDGGLVLWGEHPSIKGSSDLYAIPYPGEVHAVFREYHDTILLVDEGEKAVSSTVGHGLMHGHPYAASRFAQAGHNLDRLQNILAGGDLEAFMEVVESEALSLHAMMLASTPSYILMKPGTLSIIEAIRAYRAKTGNPVCFTLDAGANVHVLYPAASAGDVYPFIREVLTAYCKDSHHICDRVGAGARTFDAP